jgi:hypothetical protein
MLVRSHRQATLRRTRSRTVRCPHCGFTTTEVSGFCPNCLLVRFPSDEGGVFLFVAGAALMTTWVSALLILGNVLGWY